MRTSVRLGVTGLSRSGKTVFTTALVHNLLLARERPQLLPFFALASERRILGARLAPAGDYKPFPYADHLAALIRPEPAWPPSTTGLSEARITIDYRPAGALSSHLAERTATELIVVDYPGEWLLDLPLLDMTFAEWSAQVDALCAEDPRASLAADWHAVRSGLDRDQPADEALMARAGASYKAFLARCRAAPHHLTYLQPGRFLVPGDDFPDPTLLQFCPLAPLPPPWRPKRGSLYAALEARYDAYRRRVVEPFYREHFRRLDRQIILADVLTALDAGYTAFMDARRALSAILGSFRYGRSRILPMLLGRRVDRALFAATKADHITVSQYNNLRHLLQAMVLGDAQRAEAGGARIEFGLVASVKATTNAKQTILGHRRDVLIGTIVGTQEPSAVFPGEIPGRLPEPEDWTGQPFRFADFAPPNLSTAGITGIPSIHLDKALEFLIGDRFR